MKFGISEKIQINNCNLDIEILNFLPGSQGVRLSFNESCYGVLINGIKAFLPESMLCLFIENQKPIEKVKEIPQKESINLPKKNTKQVKDKSVKSKKRGGKKCPKK